MMTRSDMPTKAVPAQTIRNIITLRGISHLSYRELSRLFNVSSSTVGKYLYSFERSSLSLAKMRRLDNKALVERLSPPRVRPPKCRHNRLLGLFPDIHQSLRDTKTSLLDQWKRYNRKQPHALGYSRFAQLYSQWLS